MCIVNCEKCNADHLAALAEKETEITRLQALCLDSVTNGDKALRELETAMRKVVEQDKEIERLTVIIEKHSQAITMDTLAKATQKDIIIGGWKP